MVQFGKKKNVTDYLYTKPVIFVLFIIFILLSTSVYERYKIEREMHDRRTKAEDELSDLLENKESIQVKVDYLSGERGIEEEVRKHFDVAKDGEQVVVLIGDDEVANELESEPKVEKKWYQFWR